MPLEVICRQCKKPYTTAPGDVLSGVWRYCPTCRGGSRRARKDDPMTDKESSTVGTTEDKR